MEIGQPDPKRMRLAGHLVPQWDVNIERQLPEPSQQTTTPYTPFTVSYSRPNPHIAVHDHDRRASDHTSAFETQEVRRASTGSQNYQSLPSGATPFLSQQDQIVERDTPDEIQYRHSPNAIITESINAPTHHDSGSRINQTTQIYDRTRLQSFKQNNFPETTVSISEPFSNAYSTNSNIPLPQPTQPSMRTSEQFNKLPYIGTRPLDQQVRKKAQRAAQACDCCRTAKAKCDEGRPSCGSCKDNGKECRYRDPPPKQQDKTSADIMESLNRLESVMQKFTQQMDHLANEVNEIKKVQNHQVTHLSSLNLRLKEEHTEESHPNMMRLLYAESSTTMEPQSGASNNTANHLNSRENLGMYRMRNLNVKEMNAISDDEDDAVVEHGPPKQPSIPINHTTGAARLLLVPPIKKMCADIMLDSKFKSEKYPYMMEWKRGLLRLYGRGEGYEVMPGYDRETTEYSETSPIDGNIEPLTPVSGDEWGQIGGFCPSYHTADSISCGTNFESLPDFNRETVLELVDSYKKNINNMHPILTPNELDQLVELFLRSIQDTKFRSKQSQIRKGSFVESRTNSDSPGSKRKRSPVDPDIIEMQLFPDYKPGHPFRSISTAIILLCMALGKICQDKGKIPQLPSEQEPGSSFTGSFGVSPIIPNGFSPSPLPNNSMGASIGRASSSETERMPHFSQGQSIDGSQLDRVILRLRNIDVIPGLKYFALATDILGNQMAGSSLKHVHANVLAGLFHAQLARIMESAAYISNACRALKVILRPCLERFKRAAQEQRIVQAKDNPLLFAFWTCLQLESDIVAEIPCLQTGILTYEEDMPGPNYQAAHDDGFEQDVIESYSAQLYLRKHLNSLHSMFYKPRDPNSEDKFTALVLANNKLDEPKFPSIELVSESLNGITVCAPTMKWMIDHPDPPDDILGARLRAKYYGARVITYRPFVLQVLERSEPPCTETTQIVTEQISEEYLSEVKAPIVKHDIKNIKDIDLKALEYVRLGLKALINSTTAFYGLGHPGEKRIIVTNVWGTAHAQWGNVLTLQAAYMNPILKPLLLEQITKEELIVLVEKTMGFLALVGNPQSALAIDWKILDLTSRKNGLRSKSTLGLSNIPTTSITDLLKAKYQRNSEDSGN